MIFGNRLRAMNRLGLATARLADRVFARRVHADDAARDARLGDLSGQTKRAQALADMLDGAVVAPFTDPVTVKPRGWFK